MFHHAIDPDSTNLSGLTNTPVLWVFAAAIFAVIALQSVIYLVAIRRSAAAADLSAAQVRVAVRTGAIATIGPSLAVALVAIALIPNFGTPGVLTRVGLTGSAGYDVAAANLGAQSAGATLGGPDYTQRIFAIAFASMIVGPLVWMACALILTPILHRGEAALARVNPAVMTIVPGAALLGVFFTLALQQAVVSPVHLWVLLSSAATMATCQGVSVWAKIRWLRDWALGIAIVVALAVAAALTA